MSAYGPLAATADGHLLPNANRTKDNTGEWNCTYKYYSDADSLVETRNGSDTPIKQHVPDPRGHGDPGAHGSPPT